MLDHLDLMDPVNLDVGEFYIFSDVIGDEINLIAKRGQRLQTLIDTNRGTPWLKKWLR